MGEQGKDGAKEGARAIRTASALVVCVDLVLASSALALSDILAAFSEAGS